MKSRRVCCCGANSWALVIGWLQTIICGIGLPFIVGFIILSATNLSKFSKSERSNTSETKDIKNRIDDPVTLFAIEKNGGFSLNLTDFQTVESVAENSVLDERSKVVEVIVVLSVVAVPILIVNFAAGILLNNGVKQGNATYLKVWMVIHIIWLTLGILGFVIVLSVTSYCGFLFCGILILNTIINVPVVIFCIWVVNVHRKELLGRWLTKPQLRNEK